MLFKKLFSGFSLLTGLSARAWITVIAVVVLIAAGLYVRYLWNDYNYLKEDIVVKEQQNKQLEDTNKKQDKEIKDKVESEKIDDKSSDTLHETKINNEKKFDSIKKKKDIELSKIKPIENSGNTIDNIQVNIELEKTRSSIRYSQIEEAYCATQETCDI